MLQTYINNILKFFFKIFQRLISSDDSSKTPIYALEKDIVMIAYSSKGGMSAEYLENIPFSEFLRKRDIFINIKETEKREIDRATKK